MIISIKRVNIVVEVIIKRCQVFHPKLFSIFLIFVLLMAARKGTWITSSKKRGPMSANSLFKKKVFRKTIFNGNLLFAASSFIAIL
jgi:hypothetical protein